MQSSGTLHLVPIYRRREEELTRNLCEVLADTAAGEQKIAAGEQKIAAGEQKIAALKADTAAGKELGALFDETKRIADKITAGSTNPADFEALTIVYTKLLAKQSAPGVSEVLPLIASLVSRGARLKGRE
jgi:hypothetical protein